jgi:phosphoglycerate kinase
LEFWEWGNKCFVEIKINKKIIKSNMNIRRIQDAKLENKKVLMRVDFNVAIKDGSVKEKFKIAAAKESVDFINSKLGTKLALISHLGRPEGKVDPEFSLSQLVNDAENILGVKIKFISDCIGEKVKEGLENLQENEILLLENVRFHKGDEKNEAEFSKQLSENFDSFINDAFSVCHRNQASVTGVTETIPSFAGFWLQKEIENLEKVKENPKHPAVAIIGGAKIETKLPLINSFEKKYDSILVGGKIANEAVEKNMKFSRKVLLPVDFAGDRLDIGEETISQFKEIIAEAKTIVWNGPMGKFEQPPFDNGTKQIMQAVIASGAYTVSGGGESIQFLEENKVFQKFSFVSTGGGAMLDYLSGNPMPGIEALRVD